MTYHDSQDIAAVGSIDSKHCVATIAICTYNRLHTLPRTLDSLSALRGKYTFEVLVVNGPSTDGTTEFLAARNDIRVFHNAEVNLAISRNIAISNAIGRYISFLDDDAIPEADWLDIIIDRFEAEPDLSAVGGFIRDSNGIKFQGKYVYCDSMGNEYPCESEEYASFFGKDKNIYLSLTGTNSTFRRADLLKIHGFDEVFAYFLDETDVNKRMHDLGMRSVVIPEAEIHHKFAPSHLRNAKKIARNMLPIARSVAYFTMRHGVPEFGWAECIRRLQDLYSQELMWKSDNYAYGDISRVEFAQLMGQVYDGILEGIDRHFTPPEEAAKPENRLNRHTLAVPAVIRQMRPANEPLRLCMFSQDHARKDAGGIGRWTNLVAKGLAERGNEVTVIGELKSEADPEYCDFLADGYWSHNIHHFHREEHNEIDCLGLPAGMANVSKRKLSEMRRVSARRQFQVASSPIWDVEGAALLGTGEIPTVLSLHTCAGLMLSSKPEWRENKDFYRNHVLKVISAEIQALRRTPMILANSRAILRDISESYNLDLFARPHVVVPHGISDIVAPQGLLEQRLRAQEETAAPLRILFLGRLETRKGIAHLVPVLERLLAAHQNLHVDLVGARTDDKNYELVARLLEAFPQQVIWHGFVDDDGLDVLMRKSDIFFGPSLYESFGLIYAEAMRYSMPCVAYATGGVTEVIEDGYSGFLAPLGDQAALYHRLEQLVTDKSLRHQMSQAARGCFEKNFHYTKMAAHLDDVYREVAARSRF